MISAIKARWLLAGLILILLVGGWFASYRLAEPGWEMSHHGYILAEWPHNAANYLHFGYLSTGLGQVMDYGWNRPAAGFTYRIDHPPLTSWLISLDYLVFGVREWSARLVPLLFSLATVVLVFVFASSMAGRGWALLGAVFAAGSPALLYFARLPVPHVPAVFFSLAVFLLYRRWLAQARPGLPWAMWAVFAAGAWTDWIVYFTLPWVLVHYVLFTDRKVLDRRFVLTTLGLPFVAFGLYMAWSLSLGGVAGLAKLVDIVRFRTLSESAEYQQKYVFTLSEFYTLTYNWTKLFFTPTLWLLAIVWTAALVGGWVRRRRMASDQFLVASLFLFGLTHNLIFRNRVYIHNFDMVFQWIPFFAIAGMLGARVLVNAFAPRWRVVAGIAVVGVSLAGFVAQSNANVAGLHTEETRPAFYLVGRYLNEAAPKDAQLLGSFAPDIRLRYYMDRPFEPVTGLEDFEARLKTGMNYSHYVLGPGARVAEDLRRRLVEGFPARNVDGYAIFDLKGTQGARLLVDRAMAIPNATQVQFGDALALVGYELSPVSAPPAASQLALWLREHFNAHTEFMPEYARQFRLTYYWECLTPSTANYVAHTTLETEYGQAFAVDESHPLGNGAYPTSLWRQGDIVRDEYTIAVPADAPALRYTPRVRVTPADATEPLAVRGAGVDGDGVRLAGLDIAPDRAPEGSTEPPAMAEQAAADLGDNLVLQGYRLSGRTVEAGQTLKVDTAWLCRGPVAEDQPAWVELAAGNVKVRGLLGVEPTRLWQPGRYYVRQGELALSRYLLPGRYALSLTTGAGQARAALGEVEVKWPGAGRWVVDQMGAPDGAQGDVRPLDTDRPLRLKFNLEQAAALEVAAGWTGEALCAETRVEVSVQSGGGERYLGTWTIPRGRYTVQRLTIPASVTAAGENVVSLRVPANPPKPHYVGWRAWLDAVLPDVLYDTSGPYDGWIWADFVEVNRGGLRNEWRAYSDLAQSYARLNMSQEVVDVLAQAGQQGLHPERADDLNVYLDALQATGASGEAAQMPDRLLHALVPHWAGLNLGDRVEYLGYGLSRLDAGRGQLTLYFRGLSAGERDYTLWLHQYDDPSSPGFAALDQAVPTSSWKAGRVYQVTQAVKPGPGKVRFVFGLWGGDEGSRLFVAGQPGQHEIDLGWLER